MTVRELARTSSAATLAATCLFVGTGMADARAAYAGRPEAGRPRAIRTIEGITEYALDNGLQILLLPDPSTPTVTVVTTYRVGSRHEGRGEAGMAHMLEHMGGKKTRDFDSAFEALARHGADYNATTWFDRTNFYETLTASDENLEFAIHLEAERMSHLALDPGELATEMDVITNEVQMMENEPATILSQRMLSAAYLWHNYGKTVIGNLSDIQRYPVENLRRFYETYYRPDNATLFISGRFDVDRAFQDIDRYFGSIPRPARSLGETYTEEPVQDGPRLVTLERAGSVPAAGLVYHTPAASHADAPALLILHSILTSTPSGRLHRALVEKGLATRVDRGDPDHLLLAEPGVFEIIAEGNAGQEATDLLEAMIGVVEGIGEAGVSEREVELARARLAKKLRPIVNDSGQLGIYLSEWIAAGDWRLFFVQRDRLKEVSPGDVGRVARTYLVESNRTAGVFVPVEEPVRAAIPATPEVAQVVAGYVGSEGVEEGDLFVATPESIEKRTLRMTIEPGIRVAVLEKRNRGRRVCARFRLRYGTEAALTGQRIAARLLPDLMMRGTRDREYQPLQDSIDLLRCDLEVTGYEGVLSASIDTDRDHLIPALELLAEILERPRFDPQQFEILKRERLAKLESWRFDPIEQSIQAVRRGLYPWPRGNVHYVPTTEEEIAILRDLSLQSVRGLYEDHVGASHMDVSIVGNFDSGAALAALGDLFGSWTSPSSYERIAMPYRPIVADPVTVLTPDKQMAMVTMATLLELRDDDPDFPAVEIAAYVLAESGEQRLKSRLRLKEGLTYHTSGRMDADDRDRSASLYAFALCSPGNAPRTLDILREEVERWIASGITEEELAAAKQSYGEQFELELSDDAFVARELAKELEIDRCFSYHADLLGKIRALTVDSVRDALRRQLGGRPFLEIMAGDLAADRSD